MADAEDRKQEMKLLRAVGEIDEKYIDEAQPGNTKKIIGKDEDIKRQKRSGRIVLLRVLVSAAVLFAVAIPVFLVHEHLVRTASSGSGSPETVSSGEEAEASEASSKTASSDMVLSSAAPAAEDESRSAEEESSNENSVLAAAESESASADADAGAADEKAQGMESDVLTDCDSLEEAENLAGFSFDAPDAGALVQLSESEDDDLASIVSMRAEAAEGKAISVLYLDGDGNTVLSITKQRDEKEAAEGIEDSTSFAGSDEGTGSAADTGTDSTADTAAESAADVLPGTAQENSTQDTYNAAASPESYDTASCDMTFSEDGFTFTIGTEGKTLSSALLEKIAALADDEK